MPLSRRLALVLALFACFHLAAATAPERAAMVAQAMELQRQGKWEQAGAVWRTLLKSDPADVQALVMSGVVDAQLNRFAEAEGFYRQALAHVPGNPEILLDLGLAYFKSTDLRSAVPVFDEILKAQPDNRRVQTLLGFCYYGLGDFATAIPYLEKAPEAQTSPELRQMLAHAYIWTKQTAKAGDMIASLLRDSPDSAPLHVLSAEALDNSGRTDEAIAEFQAAARVKDDEPNVHFGLGYLYWKKRDNDAAEREFHRELAIDPRHAPALAYLGDIEFQRGHFAAAENLLRQAIALQPNIRVAHYDLALVLQQDHKHAEAVVELTQAIQIDPARPDAHYRLAASYRALGRSADADRELETVRTLHQTEEEDTVMKVTGPPSH